MKENFNYYGFIKHCVSFIIIGIGNTKRNGINFKSNILVKKFAESKVA